MNTELIVSQARQMATMLPILPLKSLLNCMLKCTLKCMLKCLPKNAGFNAC